MIKYYCCLIKFEKHLVRMIYVFFEIQPVWKLQYVNKHFCTKKGTWETPQYKGPAGENAER